MDKLISYILFIGTGITLTLGLLIGGLLLGLTLGITLSVLRYNKVGAGVINALISILRGTPLILQLSFVYFSAPNIIGIRLNIR